MVLLERGVDLPLEIATLQGFYDPSHYLSDKSALKHLGLD